MILIVHNEKKIIHIDSELFSDTEQVSQWIGQPIVSGILKIAESFPDETIGWVHEMLLDTAATDQWESLIHHPLELLSYEPSKKYYMCRDIEYLDFMSLFVNRDVIGNVRFSTWLSSTSMGIAYAGLFRCLKIYAKVENFSLFLSFASFFGMKQGLFPYSEPALFSSKKDVKFELKREEISSEDFLTFIRSCYGEKWALYYLGLKPLYKLKSRYSWVGYIKSRKMHFQKLQLEHLHTRMKSLLIDNNDTMDVIIPTLGRRGYLYDVLKDLSTQTLLPTNVIIVEQNPNEDSISELDYLYEEEWPFTIKHTFTHQTGACNARNIAISKVESSWTFFADDDIRIEPKTLENALIMMKTYSLDAATLAVYQIGGEIERTNYPLLWHTFGSGCSIVNASYIQNTYFDMALEFGYGEDADYGMSLRKQGCTIAYISKDPMLHLKAPTGGFRFQFFPAWKDETPQPKPSPTVMYHMQKNYTKRQIDSYKVFHFVKRLLYEKPINLFLFYRHFKQQWGKSLLWANKLSKGEVS